MKKMILSAALFAFLSGSVLPAGEGLVDGKNKVCKFVNAGKDTVVNCAKSAKGFAMNNAVKAKDATVAGVAKVKGFAVDNSQKAVAQVKAHPYITTAVAVAVVATGAYVYSNWNDDEEEGFQFN